MATLTSISTPAITTADNGGTYESTVSVNVASGEDYLVVRFSGQSIFAPSAITYNGVALTQAQFQTDTNTKAVGIYYLASPASGTNDLVVQSATVSRDYQLVIDSLNGISGVGAGSAFGGFTAGFSPSFTTVAGDIVLDVISTIPAATVGGGRTTQILNTNNASASSFEATGTSTLMDWTATGDWAARAGQVFTAGAPSRSITNIDTDNNVQAGQTSVTITTVGLDASPATQTATLGGESLTVNSWSATAVNVDIPLHIDLEWGSTTNQLALTDDTGTVTLDNITLSAPTGWETVTYNGSAPNPATTESFYEYAQTDSGVGSFTMATSDILAWETQTGLTIDTQTIPVVDPPATVSGAYKIWDESLSTWTSVSSFTITDGGTFGGGSVPVDSRKSVFKIAAYLRSTGTYTAKQTNELVVEWLVDEGTTRSNLNDMLYTYLGTLGLTGSLDDRLTKWQDL